ncbi:MAG TPA: hypothetical protein VFS00_05515, partial [Polyangiaceae bacterium]|nr:hypothetical protein [Polyangiaceae bacterium]
MTILTRLIHSRPLACFARSFPLRRLFPLGAPTDRLVPLAAPLGRLVALAAPLGRLAPLTALVALASGCTTLGPMPATTGVSPSPAGRPGAELQAGFVPSYYLSSSVQRDGGGAAAKQLSVLLEPDKLLHAPGLFVGGRVIGGDNNPYVEPMLGYRRALDDDGVIAASATAYGTHAKGSDGGASYEATRGGVELGVDVRLTPRSEWFELHGLAGGSFTGLSAKGNHCLDTDGRYAVDCDVAVNGVPNVYVSSAVKGV